MTDEAKEVFPHGISQHDAVILEFMMNIKWAERDNLLF